MKILCLTSKSLGGSGKYVSVLGAGLKQQYPDIHADVLFYPSGVSQDREFEAAFEATYFFSKEPNLNPFRLLGLVVEARKLILREGYNIVHTHTSLGGLIGRLATVGTSAVCLHTLHAFGADEFTPQPMKSLYWLIEKAIDPLTKRYIAPSEYMRQYGKRIHLLSERKVSVVYNSLPLTPPDPQWYHHQRDILRREWQIEDSQTVLLFCGRLEPQKGFDVLLRALDVVRNKTGNFKLVVCGIGECEAEYRALAEQLGVDSYIKWEGWVSSTSKYYTASDIYVMPSRWESFGLVFLEAMNFRKPIIATTTQAIPEVVANGVNGLLSANEDIQGLADNLLTLINDPAQQKVMGDAGYSRLYSTFSFEHFLQETVSVYRSIV